MLGDRTGAYRNLVGKQQGKRPLGKPKGRWRKILKCIFKNWDMGHGLD
jgi:hypothetical protein